MEKLTMTFEELQEEWKAIEIQSRSLQDLRKMTQGSHLKRLRVLKRNLIIECAIFLFIFTISLVVLDLYSGPFALTLAFIACNALYIINSYLGYRYLRTIPNIISLRSSLKRFSQRMATLRTLSYISNISMSIVTMLIMQFRGDSENPMVWTFILPGLIGLVWLTSRVWVRRIKEARKTLRDFEVGNR